MRGYPDYKADHISEAYVVEQAIIKKIMPYVRLKLWTAITLFSAATSVNLLMF